MNAMGTNKANLPDDGEIVLDHIGHFVADIKEARAALQKLGFAPTPVSVQSTPTGQDGAPELTGTGNICVMLECGYLEFLFWTADTPIGREFNSALQRRPGVHLAAFAVADAEAEHARLAGDGFAMRPLVRMRRVVETEDGEDEARFTVARVDAGEMPEGRIQSLTHHTETAVWQPRWLRHSNSASALSAVLIVSAEADAAARFSRFCERPVRTVAAKHHVVSLDRGYLVLMDPERAARTLPEACGEEAPFFAAYAVTVKSLDVMENHLISAGQSFERFPDAIRCPFPPALGRGQWLFVEDDAAIEWL